MSHHRPGLPRRILRAVWETLQAAGAIWVAIPDTTSPPHTPPSDLQNRPAPGPPLPAAGHPERLAAHIPPDEQERLLWSQLE